jgi:hypothetical protein
MANCALTLSQLSMVALNVGLKMGFNAAEVESWYESSTDSLRIIVRFADKELLNKPRMRTPSGWARSYDNDAVCTREPTIVELPESIVYEASYDIEKRLMDSLLELVH